MIALRERWIRHWAMLGLAGDDACFERILAAYSEPPRHYHSLQHLSECLDLFERTAQLADHPGEVAIALWFHDAVYIPQARDNEIRSAAWAGEALRAAGADEGRLERVQALIMATAHDRAPACLDARLAVEIDLAILGAAPARFAQYEQQVRREYVAVPDTVYHQKRRELLAHFLARSALYTIPALHAELELPARRNLRDAIAATPP